MQTNLTEKQLKDLEKQITEAVDKRIDTLKATVADILKVAVNQDAVVVATDATKPTENTNSVVENEDEIARMLELI